MSDQSKFTTELGRYAIAPASMNHQTASDAPDPLVPPRKHRSAKLVRLLSNITEESTARTSIQDLTESPVAPASIPEEPEEQRGDKWPLLGSLSDRLSRHSSSGAAAVPAPHERDRAASTTISGPGPHHRRSQSLTRKSPIELHVKEVGNGLMRVSLSRRSVKGVDVSNAHVRDHLERTSLTVQRPPAAIKNQTESLVLDDTGTRANVVQNLSSHSRKLNARKFRTISSEISQLGRDRPSVFGLRVLDPTGTFYLAWTIFMLVTDATYTAFGVPLTLAFDSGHRKGESWFNAALACDMITGLIFLGNLLLSFNVGYLIQSGSRRMLVRDGPISSKLYITSYHFYIDLLACIPFLFQLVTMIAGFNPDSVVFELQALRLTRLFRVAILVRRIFLGSFTSTGVFGGLSPLVIHILQMIYLILFLVNALACMMLGAGRAEGTNGPTWLMAAGNDNSDIRYRSGLRQYLSAIYFTTTTISTTGYGDIGPKNAIEQGLCILMQFAGVLFFAFITSNFTQALSTASQSFRTTEEYRQRMEALNKWFRKTRLPLSVETRIRSFYDRSWKKTVMVDDTTLVSDLPPFLRSEVAQHALGKLLKRVDSFRYLDKFTTESVAAMAHLKAIPAGHDVFHQGEPSNSIFILTEGDVVVVEGDGNAHTAVIEAPAILGEISLLWLVLDTQRPRQRTYRAFTSISLWQIETEAVGHLLESSPQTLYSLIRGLEEHISRKGPTYYPSIGLDSRDLSTLKAQVLERVKAGFSHQQGAVPVRSGHRGESLEALGAAQNDLSDSEGDEDGHPGAKKGPGRRGKGKSNGLVARIQRASATLNFLHGGQQATIQRKSAAPSARPSAGDTFTLATTSSLNPAVPPVSVAKPDASSHRRTRSDVPNLRLGDVSTELLLQPPRSDVPPAATPPLGNTTPEIQSPREGGGGTGASTTAALPHATLSPPNAPIGILARVSAAPYGPGGVNTTPTRPTQPPPGRVPFNGGMQGRSHSHMELPSAAPLGTSLARPTAAFGAAGFSRQGSTGSLSPLLPTSPKGGTGLGPAVAATSESSGDIKRLAEEVGELKKLVEQLLLTAEKR